MVESNFVKVKICCIQNLEEATLAIKCGASSLGLVSEMPGGPGVINEDKIAGISLKLPAGISSFLLTSKTNVKEIIEQLKRTNVNTVQIVDKIERGNYSDIRNEIPNIKIVQVIHVNDNIAIEEAKEASKSVDAILLDSGNQKLKIKELGGTGRVHNWQISKIIRKQIDVPLFLAGGLNPDNILEAIKTVRPFGVDVCSGVRTNGLLDEEKLKRFFEKVNAFNLMK